jgi:hypothetical protein
MKLIIRHHPAPRLRMHAAILPYIFMVWCLIKYRDKEKKKEKLDVK